MMGLAAALWAELLKLRRSRVPWLTAAGFSLAPLVGGLFMWILADPERARRMGVLGTKAQLQAGAADWPSLLALLAQATAVGGALLFALVTAWIFGREHVDRTAKELLALPTSRQTIVTAKLAVVALWALILTMVVLAEGLAVGSALHLPGGSRQVFVHGGLEMLAAAALTLALMPPVALLASAGRGYLAPLGWAILTLFLAQIAAATGWGGWFPWSVPALHANLAGPRADHLGPHSYALVALAGLSGLVATYLWWRRADQVG